jgi:hypothetical protein
MRSGEKKNIRSFEDKLLRWMETAEDHITSWAYVI